MVSDKLEVPREPKDEVDAFANAKMPVGNDGQVARVIEWSAKLAESGLSDKYIVHVSKCLVFYEDIVSIFDNGDLEFDSVKGLLQNLKLY